jgi:sporulation protein YlmC with PRC-barrel domain
MTELIGKMVVGEQAQTIGEVSDIEFDEKTMKLTNIYVKLKENAIETMGLKKPRLGSVKVDIPVDAIKAISDIVALNKSTQELKTIVRRR